MGNEFKPTQLAEQDIANLGMDPLTSPPIPYRGMLYWAGAGWARWAGQLIANPGVIIGDVNVVSSTLPTGAATAANQLLDDKAATGITEYNTTLTDANTEYSQALPANTRKFEFQARTDVDIRFAFTTGKVATPTAPYFTLKAGMQYSVDATNLSSKTLYLASATASTVIEIIAWS